MRKRYLEQKNKITNYFRENKIPIKEPIKEPTRECYECRQNDKMFCYNLNYKCLDENCIWGFINIKN